MLMELYDEQEVLRSYVESEKYETEMATKIDNIKWDAVFQSIVDTWLPLFGVIAAIIAIAVAVHIIKKK